MITFDPTIIFGAGTVVGALAMKLIDIIIANSRDTRTRGIQILNAAAEDFRNALLTSINKIESGKYGSDIILEDFTSHRELMLRFSHCLKGRAKRRFETDWNTYQNWYQEICCRGIAERMYPPEGQEEYGKKCKINPVDLMKKLISHTSPK
jgi:hypothetical protein